MIRGLGVLVLLLAAGCEPAPPTKATKSDVITDAPDAAKECDTCGYRAGPSHLCGLTHWCETCQRGVAEPNHVCGHTTFCLPCRRETGMFHSCGDTKICWNPRCRAGGQVIEKGSNHVCGETAFCVQCRVEANEGHDCRLGTYACPRCEVEVSKTHACGLSQYCPTCRREKSNPIPCREHVSDAGADCEDCRIPHKCGQTFFCPTCRTEKPTTHYH